MHKSISSFAEKYDLVALALLSIRRI